MLHFTLGRREFKFTIMDIATNLCVAFMHRGGGGGVSGDIFTHVYVYTCFIPQNA